MKRIFLKKLFNTKYDNIQTIFFVKKYMQELNDYDEYWIAGDKAWWDKNHKEYRVSLNQYISLSLDLKRNMSNSTVGTYIICPILLLVVVLCIGIIAFKPESPKQRPPSKLLTMYPCYFHKAI